MFSEQCRVDSVSHSECDDNDDNNNSGSEFHNSSDDGSPHTSFDFCRLDIWHTISEWCGVKTGKQKLEFILNRIFNLTLLSRGLHHNDVCDSIVQTAEHFQDTFHMSFDEGLEHAVLKRRFLIRDILAVSAREGKKSKDGYTSDNSIKSNDNDMGNGKSGVSEFDIWKITNDKLDIENVSGDARAKRGSEHLLCLMRIGIAWRRENIYKAIMLTLKKAQVSKNMSFAKALKYAIHQNRFKIRKKLVERDDDSSDDESGGESENDVVSTDMFNCVV